MLSSSNHSGILNREIEAASSALAYPMMIENSFTSMLSGTLRE